MTIYRASFPFGVLENAEWFLERAVPPFIGWVLSMPDTLFGGARLIHKVVVPFPERKMAEEFIDSKAPWVGSVEEVEG